MSQSDFEKGSAPIEEGRGAGTPRPTQELSRESIGFEDLGRHWRVDVERVWRGLLMAPTWAARALWRDDRRRWHEIGKPILNDEGPIAAISDLLSLLDLGELPR